MVTEKSQVKKKETYDKKIVNLRKKIQEFKKEVKQLQQDLKEKNDKLLRSYADFQNYQKRVAKELLCKEEETKKKYLSELIDLYDVLKKAFRDDTPKNVLKLILYDLERFFEKEQIKTLDCVGEPFDHNLHHAVSTVEKGNCKNGTIVEEIKKGYLIGNKLLRAAQVIVAKKKKADKKEVKQLWVRL